MRTFAIAALAGLALCGSASAAEFAMMETAERINLGTDLEWNARRGNRMASSIGSGLNGNADDCVSAGASWYFR